MNTVTSSDGTTIAFDRLGDGPPVILVGGAFSYRAFPGLVQLTELLAPHFTAINYDRRGRGDSGDTAPYAVEREIEDLEALVDAAGGSAFVFGLSSGAAFALEAAASGLKIGRLAFYEPPFMVDDSGFRPPADHEAQLKELIAANRRGNAVKFFMRRMVGVPAVFVAVMRLLPVWSRLKTVAHALPYDAAVMGDFSLPFERAGSVTIPTLVVGGEKSDARYNGSQRSSPMDTPYALGPEPQCVHENSCSRFGGVLCRIGTL